MRWGRARHKCVTRCRLAPIQAQIFQAETESAHSCCLVGEAACASVPPVDKTCCSADDNTANMSVAITVQARGVESAPLLAMRSGGVCAHSQHRIQQEHALATPTAPRERPWSAPCLVHEHSPGIDAISLRCPLPHAHLSTRHAGLAGLSRQASVARCNPSSEGLN